jgi:hypothetical protein
MSTPESHPEVLEALRLLHERVARIESLHPNALQLPTNWNPFSGASKDEIRRMDEMQVRIDQLTRAGVLHDALDSNLLRLINDLQARVGIPPTPPLPYAPGPHQVLPFQPQPYAPSAPPMPPPGYPVPPDPYAPNATVVPPAAARLHALNAKYRRFIQEAELLGKASRA